MKNLTGAASIACLGALATVGAQAAEPAGAWYVSPGAHGVFTDDLRAVDDDFGYNLAIGKAVSEHLNLELDGWRGSFDGAGGNDLVMNTAGLNAVFVFYRESRLSPYLLLGGGWIEKNYELTANESNAYMDTGAGLLMTLFRSSNCSSGLALRADARARHDFTGNSIADDRLVDFMAGLGLHFYFGGPACAREPEPLPPPPPPPPPAGPIDSDGDGVTDDLDRCPGTLAGIRVDATGCELDTDGDGVLDSKDKCPNTPKGDKVDADGCSLTLRLEVTFDSNSSQLRPESNEYLDRVAERLNELAYVTGVIEGHTDSNGSDAHNQDLSERRAKAVLDYLVDKGVDGSRFTAAGFGESQPVADNATPEGRAQNRRVVLRRTDQR
jgi:OOP family OmpA-OmpF porin